MVLPADIIDDLELPTSYPLSVRPADGTVSEVVTYRANVECFGNSRNAEVIAGDASLPLLGLNLLLGLELIADYRNVRLSLSPKAKIED